MTRDDEFVRETRDSLRQLTNGLLALERDGPTREQLDELFRTAHTLKGNCGMAGLDGARRLAHAVEDFLSRLRDETLSVTPELIDASLAAVDDIDTMLDEWHEQGAVTTDPASTVSTLREAIQGHADDPEQGSGGGARPPSDESPAPSDPAPANDTEGFDPAVVDALESASDFDDLEGLLREMDPPDGAGHGTSERWGTFEDVDSRATDGEDPGGSASRRQERDGRQWESEAPLEPMDDFDDIKRDVEQDAVSTLDGELADAEFGEFDDDDDLSIQDLLDGEVAGADTSDESVDGHGDPVGADPATQSSGAAEPFSTEDEISLDDFGTGLTGSTADAPESRDDDGRDTRPSGEATVDAEPIGSVADTDTEEENPFVQADIVDAAERDDTEADRSIGGEASGGDGDVDSGAATPDETVQPADLFGDTSDATSAEAVDAASSGTDASSEWFDVDFAGDESPGPDDDDTTSVETSEIGLSDVLPEDQHSETGPSLAGDDPDTLPDIDEFAGSVPDAETAEREPTSDLSFRRDEHTVEFESRFAERFGADSDGDREPLVQAASSTIEESRLDANLYQSSEPTEYPSDAGDASPTDRVQSITVDVENADTLLNLVDQLSLAQLRLRQADERTRDDHLSKIESVTAELRHAVMDLRLMPLSSVDAGLPRIVRDVARQQGKQVAFEMSDEGVTLDRSIIEKLGDPLGHLVRNAVDHGIESPRERERKDKPPEGTVELRAWRERERVVIEIEDDGRGISTDRIRQHAIDTGTCSRQEVEQLSREAVYDLVFEPGFSTATEVTDVSGRGVGMDAVKRTINSLDGTVTIESDPDVGTTVRIELPVSVAVSKLLFVDVGSEQYAIPTSVVNDVEAVDEEALTEDGRIAVEWPDEAVDRPDYVPIRDVREAFGATEDGGDTPIRADDERIVVRLDPDTQELALLCDGVGDAREAVVKPYEDLLGDVPGISGATMSEDGSLVNIIEVTSL